MVQAKTHCPCRGLDCLWLVPRMPQGSNLFTGGFATAVWAASLWAASPWPRGACAGPCDADRSANSISLAVAQMLTKDPAARVGLAAVMGHPWVTSGGQDPLQSMEQAGQVVRGGPAPAPPRRGCTAVLVHLALRQEPLHSLEQAEQGGQGTAPAQCALLDGRLHCSSASGCCLVPGNGLLALPDVPMLACVEGCTSGRQQGNQPPPELAFPHLHVSHGMQSIGGPSLHRH